MPNPPKSAGLKFDEGKPDLSLNPAVASAEMARAFMFGAWKYAPFNFEEGLSARRLLAAAKRHIDAVLAGEELDPEAYTHPTKGETRTSGAHHLGHAMASLAMYLRCRELGRLDDDRSPNRLTTSLVTDDELQDMLDLVAPDIDTPKSWGEGRTHLGAYVLNGPLQAGVYETRAGTHTTLHALPVPDIAGNTHRAELTGFYYGCPTRPATGAVWGDRPSEQDLVRYVGPHLRRSDWQTYTGSRDDSLVGGNQTPPDASRVRFR